MRRPRARRRLSERGYLWLGVLVTAVTVAIVYVSYTSTSGLPFESTYNIVVDVPNGNRLVSTDQVRIDGVRVGRVKRVEAMPGQGRPFSRAWLALDSSVDELPTDSQIRIRPSSALGATYVDIVPGGAPTTVADGGRFRLDNSRPTVDLVDLLDVFDRSTSRGIQQSFRGLGEGFAGRGPALNDALAALARMLPSLERSSAVLASPSTRLPDFIRGYASFVAALQPVSPPLARLVGEASDTFGAMAREGRAVGDTIESFPPAERAVTTAFTRASPQLRSLSRLMRDLRGGVRPLRRTLHRTNRALRDAVVPLRGAPRLARDLGDAFDTFRDVGRTPAVDGAIRKIRDMFSASRGLLQVLAPAQVYCNVIGLWGVDFSKLFTFGGGDAQALGTFGFTSAGAQGSILQNAKPSSDLGVNYLPNENAQECESGHEPSPLGGPPRLTNPPGLQSNQVPLTYQPPGARDRAIKAGLQPPDESAP